MLNSMVSTIFTIDLRIDSGCVHYLRIVPQLETEQDFKNLSAKTVTNTVKILRFHLHFLSSLHHNIR